MGSFAYAADEKVSLTTSVGHDLADLARCVQAECAHGLEPSRTIPGHRPKCCVVTATQTARRASQQRGEAF